MLTGAKHSGHVNKEYLVCPLLGQLVKHIVSVNLWAPYTNHTKKQREKNELFDFHTLSHSCQNFYTLGPTLLLYASVNVCTSACVMDMVRDVFIMWQTCKGLYICQPSVYHAHTFIAATSESTLAVGLAKCSSR